VSGDVPGNGEPAADPQVQAALARLTELDALPTQEHVAVYADVHQRLADALAGRPEDPPPGGTP
jgi:hypothetical protein